MHSVGLECWIEVASGLLRWLVLKRNVKCGWKSFVVGMWVGEHVSRRRVSFLIIAHVFCEGIINGSYDNAGICISDSECLCMHIASTCIDLVQSVIISEH